jgi:hypothetical protein
MHQQYPEHFLFSRDGYKTTAVLNYYLDEKVYAGNVLGEPALEYSITDADLSHLRGRNALFLDSRRLFKDFESEYVPPENLKTYFEEIRMLPRITLYDGDGRALRQFAVVECRGYRESERE